MPNKSLEEHFRQQVSRHPTPLDTDALWQRVAPELPDRRRGGWWSFLPWGAGGLALLLLALVLLPGEADVPAPLPATETIPAPVYAGRAVEGPAGSVTGPSSVADAEPAERVVKTEKSTDPSAGRASGGLPAGDPTMTGRKDEARPLALASPTLPAPASAPLRVPESRISYARKSVAVLSLPDRPIAAPRSVRSAPGLIPPVPSAPLPGEAFVRGGPARWSLEIGGTTGLVFRSSTSTAGSTGQAQTNNTYEKGLEAVGARALAGYHHPSGFSLRSGLLASRLNSRIRSEISLPVTTPTEAVVLVFVAADGSRTEQRGIVEVPTQKTIRTTYYDQAISLDVPLLLGYRFGGPVVGLLVEAGPVLNLRSGGNARLFDGLSGYREAPAGHFLRRRVGAGALLSATAEYGLTEKSMLVGGLNFRTFGGVFERTELSGYGTNYVSVNLQVGYRLRI